MKRILSLGFYLLFSTPLWAEQASTAARDAVFDRTMQEVDEPIMWLAIAAVLMTVALYAVHRSVFRKR